MKKVLCDDEILYGSYELTRHYKRWLPDPRLSLTPEQQYQRNVNADSNFEQFKPLVDSERGLGIFRQGIQETL